MGAALFVVLLIGFVVGILWLVAMQQRRTREAMAGAAQQLQLTPFDLTQTPEGWDFKLAYEGQVDDIPVLLALGQRIANVGTTATMITAVLVEAYAPTPLADEFTLTRSVAGMRGNVEQADPEFAKACAINSDDDVEDLLRRLASRPLRQRIAAWLTAGQGTARIDEGSASIFVFNAHFKGAPILVQRLREAAALIRELHGA